MPQAGWPMSAADRDPVPAAVTADLFLCRKHSNTQRKSGSVSVGPLSPGVYKVLFDPSRHLWWVWGLILNVIFFPPSILLELLICPWMLGIFFFFFLNFGYIFMVRSNILLLMVVQQWVAVLEFSQEKMSTRPCTLTSCFPIILWDNFCDITIFQFVGHPPGRNRI